MDPVHYGMTSEDDWWLTPMLMDDSPCGTECPPDGCAESEPSTTTQATTTQLATTQATTPNQATTTQATTTQATTTQAVVDARDTGMYNNMFLRVN